VTDGEGGLIMKNWILRTIFFSKAMKNIRKGYYLEAFYEGKLEQYHELLHKGSEKK
jgi:hypothetical protein